MHHPSHGPNLAAQATARAQANQRRMAYQFFQRYRRNVAIQKAKEEREQKLADLHSGLRSAVERPLSANPHRYRRGVGVIFFSNFVAPDGSPRVVFQCNTVMPGSGKPAGAILLSGDHFEQVDLRRESLAAACARGRLWLLAANVRFANGAAYAVRAANFRETESGPLGAWSFATAGTLRGQPFVVGASGLGLFAEQSRARVLVARPTHYDDRGAQWIWAGCSSAKGDDGNLQVVPEALLQPASDNVQARFQLAPTQPGAQTAALRCNATDDLGDPLAVVDERPAHGIVRVGNVLHFYARPNQRDRQGRPLFATRAATGPAGPALQVPFLEAGSEVTIEIPANHRDTDGNHWFVRYANGREPTHGTPVVLIGLRPE